MREAPDGSVQIPAARRFSAASRDPALPCGTPPQAFSAAAQYTPRAPRPFVFSKEPAYLCALFYISDSARSAGNPLWSAPYPSPGSARTRGCTLRDCAEAQKESFSSSPTADGRAARAQSRSGKRIRNRPALSAESAPQPRPEAFPPAACAPADKGATRHPTASLSPHAREKCRDLTPRLFSASAPVSP